jgi:hypothetical protein
MSPYEKRIGGGRHATIAREKFWSRAGFEQLDMPYLQPPLSKEAGPATYPSLIVQIIAEPPFHNMIGLNNSRRSIDRNTAISIVSSYHREISLARDESGQVDLGNDDAHQILRSSLERGSESIPLIPLSERRTRFDAEFLRFRSVYKYPIGIPQVAKVIKGED